jgi:hybrid cluster-associated redox disulfide protein
MDRSPLTADLIIEEVLARWPETVPVFVRYRLACVGCAMAPFDCLADAAAIYDVPLDRFMHDLQQAVDLGAGGRPSQAQGDDNGTD